MTVRTRPSKVGTVKTRQDFTLGSKKVGSIARGGVIVDKTRRERGAVPNSVKIKINRKIAEAEAAIGKIEKEMGLQGRAGNVLAKTKKFDSPVHVGTRNTFGHGRVTVRKRGSIQVRLRKKGAVPFNKLPKHVQISAKERTLRQLKSQTRGLEYQLERLLASIAESTKKLEGIETALQSKGNKLTQMLGITADVKGNMLNFSTTLAEMSKTIREAADVDELTATQTAVETLLTKDGDECTINPLVETMETVVDGLNESFDDNEPTMEEIFQGIEEGPQLSVDDAETRAMFETADTDIDPFATVLETK